MREGEFQDGSDQCVPYLRRRGSQTASKRVAGSKTPTWHFLDWRGYSEVGNDQIQDAHGHLPDLGVMNCKLTALSAYLSQYRSPGPGTLCSKSQTLDLLLHTPEGNASFMGEQPNLQTTFLLVPLWR